MMPEASTPVDTERLIDAILHDVRTPLAAATGYLRLLREGRVSAGEQSEHVLEQAQASLRSIAVLCANADVCRRTDVVPRRNSVAATRIVDGLIGAIVTHDVTPDSAELPPNATVQICGDWSELCHLLGHALGVLARPRKNDNAGRVYIDGEQGVFRATASLPLRPGNMPRSAFDPWVYPGLTVAAGLHALGLAGGRWAFNEDDRTLCVELEMVTSSYVESPEERATR